MPYNPSQLSALSYANGFTTWHYRHRWSEERTDPLEPYAPGFWNAAKSMLRNGDIIYLERTGAVESRTDILCVVCNQPGWHVLVKALAICHVNSTEDPLVRQEEPSA